MTDKNDVVVDLQSPQAVLDPDIRRFVNEVAASYASYPNLEGQPLSEARRIAEEVRAPWRQGGPVMARTTERTIPTRHGGVRLRFHHPDGATSSPALIYLHGGGFTLFSIDTHDRVMREYAGRSGMVVIGVDYPLSPEAKFPAALESVVDVVRWLGEHAAEAGVDASRLAIGGDSAGGNISLATCLTLRDSAAPQLRGMLLNYGGFATVTSVESERRYGGPGFMLNTDEMVFFWDNYLSGPADRQNPLAIPLLADLRGLPPAFLAIPECDILTEQSHAMARRLREAAVPVEDVIYPGATHSFLEAVSISPLAARALQDGADWLRRVLASGN
ncbi:alpha/beta hydrolase fold domain-containing protein [Phenylobacterium sp.]|uniref:alpha/beta hydrolase fold domain-containing protein n=1 Tax=Phenylobacterium sp. TaxID=1871053 RepID=UPI002FC9C4A0